MSIHLGDLVHITEGLGALVDLPNGKTIYQKGADCFEYVKDLQRFLRRDKLSQTKDVFNQLGSWNIVRRDLVPLVQANRDDVKLCYEICKLLAMLTLPPDDKSSNINDQIVHLQSFKEVFLEPHVLASFVALLAGPLERGNDKTEDDERLIELLLSLFRNLLQIPDPLPAGNSANFPLTHMQDDLIILFEKENVLAFLLALCQNAEQGGSNNFLLLEFLYFLFRREGPRNIGKQFTSIHFAVSTYEEHRRLTSNSRGTERGALGSLLDAEKKRQMNSKSLNILRPHLKGTYVVQDEENQRVLHKSAANSMAPSPNTFKKVTSPTPRGRQAGKVVAKKSKVEVGFSESGTEARVVLRNFLEKFLEDACYTNFMTALKADFENYKDKHLFGDQLNFLWFSGFVTGYFYESHAQRPSSLNNEIDISPIAISMHPSDFQKLAGFCQLYVDEKNYIALPVALSAIKEMFKVLKLMLRSSKDENKTLATRILGHIFYYNIFLEQLVMMLRQYTETRIQKRFLVDAIETADVIIELLKEYSQAHVIIQQKKKRVNTSKNGTKKKKNQIPKESKKSAKKKQKEEKPEQEVEKEIKEGENEKPAEETQSSLDEEAKKAKEDVEKLIQEIEQDQQKKMEEFEKKQVEEQREEEEEEEEEEDLEEDESSDDEPMIEKVMDARDYISNFCSGYIVHNYCLILQQYKQNNQVINDAITRMFVAIAETEYKPIMFQVSVLRTFEIILSDPSIYGTQQYVPLIQLMRSIIRDFILACQDNDNLWLFAFAWKKKTDCLLYYPQYKHDGTVVRPKKKKVSKPKNARKSLRTNVIWTDEEDRILLDSYDRYKNDGLVLDIIAPSMNDPKKRLVSVIYKRLKQLGVLSDKVSKPEGYESSEDEQPAVDESVMEIKRLMAKAGKSDENSLEFLQNEVNKAIEQGEGSSSLFTDFVIVPSTDEDFQSVKNEEFINLLKELKFQEGETWKIPGGYSVDKLKMIVKEIPEMQAQVREKLSKRRKSLEKMEELIKSTKEKTSKPKKKKKHQIVNSDELAVKDKKEDSVIESEPILPSDDEANDEKIGIDDVVEEIDETPLETPKKRLKRNVTETESIDDLLDLSDKEIPPSKKVKFADDENNESDKGEDNE